LPGAFGSVLMARAVSVCLPVWNGEKFLSQAIESVLSQTEADLELIISDDGSKDRSQEIINKYRADQRVVVLEPTEHLGLFQNYNRCIAASQAPLIKFFAHDDLFLPGSLTKIIKAFAANPSAVLISTGKEVIDAAGQTLNVQLIPTLADYISSSEEYPVSGRVAQKTILKSGVNFIGEPCTVAVRREALGDCFDASFVHIGDLEYWIRVLNFGDYIHLSEKLCKFRQHNDYKSQSSGPALCY
jgi:glycosyltransferase involved in cell wall biosynthesis